MPEIIFSNYFCGDEPEEFICFKISRQLTVSLKFRHVSAAARPPPRAERVKMPTILLCRQSWLQQKERSIPYGIP